MLTDSEMAEYDMLAFRVVADLPLSRTDYRRYIVLKKMYLEGGDLGRR